MLSEFKLRVDTVPYMKFVMLSLQGMGVHVTGYMKKTTIWDYSQKLRFRYIYILYYLRSNRAPSLRLIAHSVSEIWRFYLPMLELLNSRVYDPFALLHMHIVSMYRIC